MKPMVEMLPAINPIAILAAEFVIKPDGAPIVTPPARVALRISSISNLCLKNEENINAAIQLPASEHIVLVTMRDLYNGLFGKYPALKEGQNIHKKNVPNTAILLENFDVYAEEVGFLTFERTAEHASPKYAPYVWMAVLPPASKSLSCA